MTIALTASIPHQTDTHARLAQMGANFNGARVMFRVQLQQTGETRDYWVGDQPGDIDTLAALIAAVPQFAGLRNAIETYLAAKVAALAGSIS